VITFLQIYCSPIEEYSASLSMAENLRDTIHTSGFQEPPSHKNLSFVDHAAIYFFSGVLLWFDTISAASIRQKPQYASICAAAVGDNESRLQLPDIMGCENWAMVLVRDITVLDVWKSEMLSDGRLSMRELALRAANLELRLESGMERVSKELSERLDESPNRGKLTVDILKITHAFAAGALVYLHVITSGPNPTLPEISSSVSRVLDTLNALPPSRVRNAVWPLCIAACMAGVEQQDTWRELVQRVGLTSPTSTFGSAARAWDVVEVCWKMREAERERGTAVWECDWLRAMERIGYKVLLV
jgi:hypothetical protein